MTKMYDEITLVKEVNTQDSLGMTERTYTERTILCEVHSVTRQEFFEGGRNGLNPEYEMTVFGDDYEDERVVKYKGNTYGVYRTYRTGDWIELYVERKAGLGTV